MDTGPITRFFDREACCDADQEPDATPRGISRRVVDLLAAEGLSGRSVLEVGCGTGIVSLAALQRGAQRLTGLDLSPESIGLARERARRAGVGDRAVFEAGNGADLPLAQHDLVVLDKVVCCYPEAGSLLARAAAAARSAMVISLPPSTGLRGRLARLTIRVENAVRRLRRDPFRAYVHPEGRLHAAVATAGAYPARVVSGLIWDAVVYRRPHQQEDPAGRPSGSSG